MWYNIDFGRFAVLNLPIGLRKPGIAALVQVALKPIDSLHYTWKQWRGDNLYKIEHTGQICYLRKSLNDKFDVSLRRIYIGDGQLNETLYIFTEAEPVNVWMDNESEPETLWMYNEAETADTGLDFIVYVPVEVYNTHIHGLRAHINYYKPGGKRYAIMIIEE